MVGNSFKSKNSGIKNSFDSADPFSDFNRFISKKVKEKIWKEKNASQWSKALQGLFLDEILPELKKKFPAYCRRKSSLKGQWERVCSHIQSLKINRNVLRSNGTINVESLIQEHLKKALDATEKGLLIKKDPLQLATEISESLATVDGIKSEVGEIEKLICSTGKHLTTTKTAAQFSNPERENDPIDQLIISLQMEILAQHPQMPQAELEQEILKQLECLAQVGSLSDNERLRIVVFEYIALSLNPSIQKKEPPKLSNTLNNYLLEEITKQFKDKEGSPKEIIHFVRKTLFIYRLSTQLSENKLEKQLELAIQYLLSLSSDRIPMHPPVLHQEIYAFINLEVQLAKEQRILSPLKKVLAELKKTFKSVRKFPKLGENQIDRLQITIWKLLHQKKNLFGKTPYSLQCYIQKEFIKVYIENPKGSFESLAQTTYEKLKTVRQSSVDREFEINPLSGSTCSKGIKKKIYRFSTQHALLASSIYFDPKHPLFKCIKKVAKKGEAFNQFGSHNLLIEETVKQYLQEHPHLAPYKDETRLQLTIVYFYFWYVFLRNPSSETMIDRHIAWQFFGVKLDLTALEIILSKVCNHLPLTPLNEEEIVFQLGLIAKSV